MTRDEALDKLERAFPTHSIHVESGVWLYSHTRPERCADYAVSVQPGPDGKPCQIWNASSLELAVEMALFAGGVLGATGDGFDDPLPAVAKRKDDEALLGL